MILKDLSIGTKVIEQKSAVVFLVADHNHTAYRGTTLVTDAAVMLAPLDAAEPEHSDAEIRENGNNFYPLSNIHQWLNSDQVDWFKPAYEYDAPPVTEAINPGTVEFYEAPFYSEEAKFTGNFSYLDKPGFLTWFSREFVESVFEVDVHCHADPEPGKVFYGLPDPYKLRAKVFLLSAPEMGFEKYMNGIEGFRLPLFNDGRFRVVAPTPAAIGKPEGYVYDDCSLFYWLRTPVPGSRCLGMNYNSDHKLTDYNGASTGRIPANAVCGIRPALNLDSNVAVSSEPDSGGAYTLLLGGK